MLDDPDLSQTAALKNLRRLFWLRNVMIAGLGLAAWAAIGIYDLELPLAPIASAMGLLVALNAISWWRLRQPRKAVDMELLAQLLLDMVALTGLFYFTGGYTNPFLWMYLLPLTVAAVALPWRNTWLIAGLAVACYTGLMFWYQPLPVMQMDMSGMSPAEMRAMHHGGGFSIHLLGMWAGFVVSALVIAFFVERIGRNLREYDQLIAEAREKMLENERMLALGTLATAAAHELGTPLATMAVVAGEMVEDCADQPQLAQSLSLLRSQIDRCKQILTSITASAGCQRIEDGQGEMLDDFLDRTLTDWHDAHPATQLDCQLHGSSPAPLIAVDRTLGQALVNLLDNAADASPSRIEVSGDWSPAELSLTIRDYGSGLTSEAADRAGTPFFTTKEDRGLGLGLYLARLIFERFGGTVDLSNHPQSGTLTTVRLPLAMLLVKENK